jgi:O-antigen/teichoic acid export membrane protein
MGTRKRAFIDLAKVVISNLISLISGILVGFVIPKIMGFSDYGFYKTFALYAGYTGLLHFGISDGLYFYFSGQKLEELDQKKLHSLVTFVILFEAIVSFVGIGVSLFFTQRNPYGMIFVFVFAYSFVSHVQTVLSYVCQATKQFSFPSLMSSLKSILDILGVVALYLLNKYKDSYQVSFWLYCTIVVSTLAVESLCFVIKLWGVVFGKGQDKKQTQADLLMMLKLGFPIMIANLTSSLIMSVDKQFVSIFYPVETSNIFSIFSFAYSVLGLITAVTSAVSTVLFPYMKGKDEDRLCSMFPNLDAFLLAFVSLSCVSYFIVQWIVARFISKYNDSMPYIRVIIPGLIINSSVTVLMHNYYKAFNKEHIYFWQNIVILALAILTDLLAYYFLVLPLNPMDPIWLTVASDFTLLVWYIVSEWYLVKHYGIKHWKNDGYALSACVVFLLVAFFLDQWIGFGVYLVAIIALSLLFYWKETKGLWNMFKARRQKQPAEIK